MGKVSIKDSNTYCPQPMYLYGTYKENGDPNYGLFCWCTYCFVEEMKFVACIGEDKLTRDLIRKNGVFSATIVTEELLAEADWCGTHPGYEFDKSNRIESEKGAVLNVPVPKKSIWTLELQIDCTLRPSENYNSDIYICSIKNVLADERLTDKNLSFEEKLKLAKPVVTMAGKYIPAELRSLGDWGTMNETIK